jgi:hypothetical protein
MIAYLELNFLATMIVMSEVEKMLTLGTQVKEMVLL